MWGNLKAPGEQGKVMTCAVHTNPPVLIFRIYHGEKLHWENITCSTYSNMYH